MWWFSCFNQLTWTLLACMYVPMLLEHYVVQVSKIWGKFWSLACTNIYKNFESVTGICWRTSWQRRWWQSSSIPPFVIINRLKHLKISDSILIVISWFDSLKPFYPYFIWTFEGHRNSMFGSGFTCRQESLELFQCLDQDLLKDGATIIQIWKTSRNRETFYMLLGAHSSIIVGIFNVRTILRWCPF